MAAEGVQLKNPPSSLKQPCNICPRQNYFFMLSKKIFPLDFIVVAKTKQKIKYSGLLIKIAAVICKVLLIEVILKRLVDVLHGTLVCNPLMNQIIMFGKPKHHKLIWISMLDLYISTYFRWQTMYCVCVGVTVKRDGGLPVWHPFFHTQIQTHISYIIRITLVTASLLLITHTVSRI